MLQKTEYSETIYRDVHETLMALSVAIFKSNTSAEYQNNYCVSFNAHQISKMSNINKAEGKGRVVCAL